jgi:hypothetical protein
VEPGAEDALRQTAGVGFAELPQAIDALWRECLRTAARLHAIDALARTCARRSLAFTPAAVALEALGLPPPPGFLALGPDAMAASHARAREVLRRRPGDGAIRRQLAAIELATFDFRGALSTLAPLGSEPDVELGRAIAWLGSGETERAQAVLVAVTRRWPRRPEAHHDLGLLLAQLRYSVDGAHRRAVVRQAFEELRAFLCLRREGDDPGAWEAAAETASTLDNDLHGATHRFWPSHRRQPLPYLPEGKLPPRHRTGSAFASATCASVLEALGKAR